MNSVHRIPVDLIDMVDRIRPADEAHARLIGESIAETGQRNPIEVRRHGDRFVLVSGAHRLTGCRLVGLEEIEAKVVELDDLQARLAEIDENLFRHELTPLDRAAFMAERQRIYVTLHPESSRGGDRTKQSATFAVCFAKDAADRVGLSERTIWLAVSIAKALGPDAMRKLRGTSIARNQSELLALAKFDASKRDQLVDRIVADGLGSVREGLSAMGLGPKPEDPQEKIYQQVIAGWGRANQATRKRILAHIGR